MRRQIVPVTYEQWMNGCIPRKLRSKIPPIREKEYPQNTAIFTTGSPAAVFGALISGRVQSISYDTFGNRKIISEYHAGESFAVTTISSHIGKYAFDYVAAENSTVLLFDITDIFQSTSSFSVEDRLLAAELLRQESIRQFQRYERHLSVMLGKTLREKLMIFFSSLIREKILRFFHRFFPARAGGLTLRRQEFSMPRIERHEGAWASEMLREEISYHH